jgi:hypothetical protein
VQLRALFRGKRWRELDARRFTAARGVTARHDHRRARSIARSIARGRSADAARARGAVAV